MIQVTKNDVQVVVPVGTLENLLYLQKGLLRLLSRQDANDPIETTYLAPVVDLVEATLFSGKQMDQIERLFRDQAGAPPVEKAA